MIIRPLLENFGNGFVLTRNRVSRALFVSLHVRLFTLILITNLSLEPSGKLHF